MLDTIEEYIMSRFLSKTKIYIVSLLIGIFIVTSVITAISFSYNKTYGHEIYEEEVLQFPENFLWGSATASYQVEGGNAGSNWWQFEQEEGNILNGYSNEVGVDHYHKYKKDISLMSKLNMNSYRFSIEWSRIQPTKDTFDMEEVDHYRDVLAQLSKQGITPMVTLWHFSLPQWFSDMGGFEKSSNVTYFIDYVEFVADQLSEEVELWLTINEPMAYLTVTYISAKWPPGEKDYSKIPLMYRNLIRAHKGAYDAIHRVDKTAQVGIAEHSSYTVPYHKYNILENILSASVDYSWTHMFLGKIKNDLDFIGVHYYYKQAISLKHAFLAATKDAQEFENEDLERAYYPEGLFEVLIRFKKYDKPVYITEIGSRDIYHIPRDQFMREHVREMYYAISEGVDLRGVYYWSLLDNFEWSDGFNAKFGLIAVDLDTLQRTIKDSAWEYAQIAKCNCVKNK